MKDIGIVICNYNKEDYIVNCISSVLKSSVNNFDIYVVDNASTDNSINRIREKFGSTIKLIENRDNLGGSGGFNTGIREALKYNYKYIMLLDNDIIIDRYAIEELYKFMENHEDVGMAGSKVYFMDYPDRIWGYGGNINFTSYRQEDNFKNCTDGESVPEVLYCDYVAACSLMARTDAIQVVGLMTEENFIYWDDMEWGYRFNQSGFKVAVCGKSKIWHKAGGRNAGDTFINYYMWRNRICFFMKVLPDERVEHFAETILTELFGMIYSCKLKGEDNIIKSVMYALDDALHNVTGRADQFKILKRNDIQNRLAMAIGSAKNVMITFNDDYEGLGNVIRSLNKISYSLNIIICIRYSNCTSAQVKGQYNDFIITDKDEECLYDINLKMCNHILELSDYDMKKVYIDPWCNIIYSDEDYNFCSNYKTNLKLFLLYQKDIMIFLTKKRNKKKKFNNKFL